MALVSRSLHCRGVELIFEQVCMHVLYVKKNVKCLFIVVMRLATLASSQACHSN